MKKLLLLLLLSPLFLTAQVSKDIGITNPITVAAAGYCVDADGSAFITNAGITKTAEKDAICQLVDSLKYYSLWSKCDIIYPLVGDSLAKRYNLKDPRNLDAAYRFTFVNGTGSWTIDSSGVKGTNDVNPGGTYINSHLVPSTDLDSASMHVSVFCSVRGTADNAAHDFGATYDGGDKKLAFIGDYFGNSVSDAYNQSSNRIFTSTPNTGWNVVTRNSNTDMKIYNDAVERGSNTTASSGFEFLTMKLYFGASNYNASYAEYSSGRKYNFITVGSGLTQTDMTNMLAIINRFNTAVR